MVYGDFKALCENSPIPLCILISPLGANLDDIGFQGILPTCYARSVNVANTLIFQIGVSVIHLVTLIVMQIIVYLTRRRYTAIGRKEMIFFFWCFIGFTIGTLIVDTGVSPPGSPSSSYFVAFQVAMTGSCCWSLMYAGFTAFNYWEDGSLWSMLTLCISTLIIFSVNYIIAIFTFKEDWSTVINPTHTTALFTLFFVINAIFLSVYLISQILVCCCVLGFNLWALGALSLSVFFFASAELLLYAFNHHICTSLNHYVDGAIFSTLGNMFAIMMVYKYWDIITFDDDEYYTYTQVVPGIGDRKRDIEKTLH
ncbi:unnamed protein product [Ambrosiozyma monospora]|uniref:Chitin synthase export chaperone n=1 Tax=Ambrosiozyma monospora TaxID=43982 RepID=A0A9W7DDF1_AMBMO|nr:unnamed protein product [Ambrosiozyma monospora]